MRPAMFPIGLDAVTGCDSARSLRLLPSIENGHSAAKITLGSVSGPPGRRCGAYGCTTAWPLPSPLNHPRAEKWTPEQVRGDEMGRKASEQNEKAG